MATAEGWLRRMSPFGVLEGPARVLILTGPLWTPFAMVAPFAVLYMYQLNLTAEQIGALVSLGLGAGLAFTIVGGFFADWWGRRVALTVFDLLGFTGTFVILALAQDLRWFIAATILGACSKGSQAAWQCILVEEVTPENRAKVATAERMIMAGPSVLFPIVGAAVVGASGLIPAARIMYLVAAASIGLMALLRFSLMPDSGSGVVEAHRNRGRKSLGAYLEGLRFLSQGNAALLLAMVSLGAFGSGLAVLYSVFVTADLNVPTQALGYLAALGTAMGLVTLLPLARKIRPGIEPIVLLTSSALGLAATMLLLQARDISLVVAYVVLGGFGGLITTVATTALWGNLTPGLLRSRVVAATLAITTLAALPSGFLAGFLFSQLGHQSPWWAALGLQAVILCLALLLVLRRSPAPTPGVEAGDSP